MFLVALALLISVTRCCPPLDSRGASSRRGTMPTLDQRLWLNDRFAALASHDVAPVHSPPADFSSTVLPHQKSQEDVTVAAENASAAHTKYGRATNRVAQSRAAQAAAEEELPAAKKRQHEGDAAEVRCRSGLRARQQARTRSGRRTS